MERRIDLVDYLNLKNHPAFDKLKLTYLPPVDLPDGPTWNDRVRRAEKISEIVTREFRRHQDEYEENFLDIRDKLLGDIRRLAPPGFRLEGTTLIVPPGAASDLDLTLIWLQAFKI
jgi:hypothetical protein